MLGYLHGERKRQENVKTRYRPIDRAVLGSINRKHAPRDRL